LKKQIISTEKAPAAVGPYSQAVLAGHFVFTAGQVAIVPGTGKLVDGGISAQTVQVLDNLAAVLEKAGSSLDKVVKTTVFLQSMGDFAVMNAIYGERFGDDPPACSTVEVV
jgi:2-iminobutanoate/2-iminopropanoate deaminase